MITQYSATEAVRCFIGQYATDLTLLDDNSESLERLTTKYNRTYIFKITEKDIVCYSTSMTRVMNAILYHGYDVPCYLVPASSNSLTDRMARLIEHSELISILRRNYAESFVTVTKIEDTWYFKYGHQDSISGREVKARGFPICSKLNRLIDSQLDISGIGKIFQIKDQTLMMNVQSLLEMKYSFDLIQSRAEAKTAADEMDIWRLVSWMNEYALFIYRTYGLDISASLSGKYFGLSHERVCIKLIEGQLRIVNNSSTKHHDLPYLQILNEVEAMMEA